MNANELSNGRRSILLERTTECNAKCTKHLGTFAARAKRLSSFVRDCNMACRCESSKAISLARARERDIYGIVKLVETKYTRLFFLAHQSICAPEDFPAKLTVSFIGETEKLNYARV